MKTFGKYQVLELVGEGGFGRVYRGFDPTLKREVAIKTCHLHSADLRQRFIQEAEIAASLRHPGIVTVFDFGEEGGVPYLVQEFLTGEDLEGMVARGEPAALGERVRILREVAEALRFAHQSGIVHRDVKPGNIRVEANGAVRLMDFGIAKLMQTDRKLTQMGFSLGTVGYLSPEQLLAKDVDHRADVFSFGVLAYEVLSGRKPFAGESVTAVLYAIANDEPDPLAAVLPGAPPRLAALVERCLRKEPGERFQHMGRVVEELDLVREELRGGSGTMGERGGVAGAGAAASAGAAAAGLAVPAGMPATSGVDLVARRGRRAWMALGVGAAAVAVLGILNLATFTRGAEEAGVVAAGGSGDPGEMEWAGPGTEGDPGSDPGTAVEGAVGTGESGSGSQGSGEGAAGGGGGAGPEAASPPPSPADGSGPGPSPNPVPPPPPPAGILEASRLILVGAGADPGWDRAEAALLRAWLRAGLRVPDPAALERGRVEGAARGDGAALRALAAAHGAATLVVATLRTDVEPSVPGFFTGSAELILRRYDGATGDLLGTETVLVGSGGVPGKMASTGEGARGDAAAEAGERGANLVLRAVRR